MNPQPFVEVESTRNRCGAQSKPILCHTLLDQNHGEAISDAIIFFERTSIMSMAQHTSLPPSPTRTLRTPPRSDGIVKYQPILSLGIQSRHPFRCFALAMVTSIAACVVASNLPAQSIVLTDIHDNTRTESRIFGPKDFGKVAVDERNSWSIHKTTLRGGKQEGCELVIIDNGAIEIILVPTRGMSILQVTRKSQASDSKRAPIALKWDSPVKEVVHPQYIRLESRGGLGWLEGFNEWMVRCGLESAGHPGKDQFVNNVGDQVDMDLTLHGKIGNIPASKVTLSVDSRIRVQGIVHERMFYGPKLELITEVSTAPGSTSFTLTDKLVNHGASDQEFQLIYHTNFGRPLLEEGAKTLVTAERIMPMNAHAGKSIATYSEYGPPTLGFIEQVYLAFPKSDAEGKSHAMIRNRKGDLAVQVSWKIEQLPYFTLWKNSAAEADGYVTGLEPGTGFPFNRNIERKFGRVPKIGPGESRMFELEYSLYEGTEQVSREEEKLRKIQGNSPQLMVDPPSASRP